MTARSFQFIVLHTAGAINPKTRRVVHQRMEDIDRYHREHNGWRSIGYHVFIEQDGAKRRGRPDEAIGAHVSGFNHHSLGLCVSGHGDYSAWNAAQETAALEQCAEWCSKYSIPVEHVIGHHETDEHGGPPVHKTCPGTLVDMVRFRGMLTERLNET